MTEELVVVPGTPDQLDDIVTILGGNPEACLCQYWRLSSGDFNRARGPRRVRLLRAQLGEEPPAGMVAYLGDEPVGWCGFGVRQRVQRLVRSRTIPAIDERPVWSIYCFTVRTGHRRKGIARALLAGLIEYARDAGAPALEAYPVETAGLRIHGTAAYVGVASMFVDAGFVRIAETGARSDHLPRTLMRLELSDTRH